MHTEEETLRIDLPWNDVSSFSFDAFTNENRKNQIQHLVIVQECYRRHECHPLESTFHTIPDTIINLTELETISITANLDTLPKCLCTLKKLKLLDLTGCYNIQSISAEVRAMHNLRIKFGDSISPASAVVVIGVPRQETCTDIFRVLSSDNKGQLSQLIIHQEPQEGLLNDNRQEIVIPDDILYEKEDIRCIMLRGNIQTIPS